ncbi:hypothetical protein BDV36DRAFT_260014 [Aspergillus pseudocaelatus]|uniref:Uncharacterized protein n=1 Tax=Aspergillus pseudocaelatus TaxID=1825620 RepID=A0ABQ6WH55_9EURO|nr:hypothetical protein BDV36DRAFT_260014 [Aspergillus pseudocaelatus]
MVVYTAENEDEVRWIIEKDVYATSGVWDLEKVQIWPVSVPYSLSLSPSPCNPLWNQVVRRSSVDIGVV